MLIFTDVIYSVMCMLQCRRTGQVKDRQRYLQKGYIGSEALFLLVNCSTLPDILVGIIAFVEHP